MASLLEVVFCDDHLIVVNKPAGLLSVPGRGPGKEDCAIARVQAQFADARIVHRLDMDTSGLLLMARGIEMERALSKAFQSRTVDKRYEALVTGHVQQAEGEIDLPLICDWPNRPRQMVDHAIGKPSQTRYRVLAYDAATDSTRLALTPLTGRSHQLRVHLQAIGHPILGDPLYGDAARGSPGRLCLHAGALGFRHPVSGEALLFECAATF